ncbi:MAG: hypothetical protein ABL921_34550, partial [Pirellula sp.]
KSSKCGDAIQVSHHADIGRLLRALSPGATVYPSGMLNDDSFEYKGGTAFAVSTFLRESLP